MKILQIALMLAAAAAFSAPAVAQSSGDKMTGSGGTNGQQSPSTSTSSGSTGSGQH